MTTARSPPIVVVLLPRNGSCQRSFQEDNQRDGCSVVSECSLSLSLEEDDSSTIVSEDSASIDARCRNIDGCPSGQDSRHARCYRRRLAKSAPSSALLVDGIAGAPPRCCGGGAGCGCHHPAEDVPPSMPSRRRSQSTTRLLFQDDTKSLKDNYSADRAPLMPTRRSNHQAAADVAPHKPCRRYQAATVAVPGSDGSSPGDELLFDRSDKASIPGVAMATLLEGNAPRPIIRRPGLSALYRTIRTASQQVQTSRAAAQTA